MSYILLKVLALIFIIYLVYLCYMDYNYREVRRRVILLAYPVVFLVNWVLVDFKFMLFFSSIILFVTLYVSVLLKPNSFGAIDILAAPLFTIWFNEWSIIYSLLLIILNSLFWNLGVVKKLFTKSGEPLSNPFLITMTLVFFLMIITVPNNFVKILLF